ncbi:hypothetical protein [Legionella maioricensis]|uniref:Uncharacterized protein n=1 Tax=Legionella maioricensis TaxID=2896528 RepID=A0A9X2D1V0_9GAMM|nr:hypothetical protein [Legionella maioricensis]MCL9684868.1 hypothetical protein [Legionella maioricensis]MCL9688944.1 hypothetical protein [Legionella maioricensis]
MRKTIIAVLILVPATFMIGCVTQRSSYSYGYNTDYSYKKASRSYGNSGPVSYGLDFGKGYGLNYGPGDYGNGDYANCNYGNCDYAHDYGNTNYNYNLAYGSGENKSLDYNDYHHVGQTYTRTWVSKSVTWRHVVVDKWNASTTRRHNGVEGWYDGGRWNKSVTIYNR